MNRSNNCNKKHKKNAQNDDADYVMRQQQHQYQRQHQRQNQPDDHDAVSNRIGVSAIDDNHIEMAGSSNVDEMKKQTERTLLSSSQLITSYRRRVKTESPCDFDRQRFSSEYNHHDRQSQMVMETKADQVHYKGQDESQCQGQGQCQGKLQDSSNINKRKYKSDVNASTSVALNRTTSSETDIVGYAPDNKNKMVNQNSLLLTDGGNNLAHHHLQAGLMCNGNFKTESMGMGESAELELEFRIGHPIPRSTASLVSSYSNFLDQRFIHSSKENPGIRTEYDLAPFFSPQTHNNVSCNVDLGQSFYNNITNTNTSTNVHEYHQPMDRATSPNLPPMQSRQRLFNRRVSLSGRNIVRSPNGMPFNPPTSMSWLSPTDQQRAQVPSTSRFRDCFVVPRLPMQFSSMVFPGTGSGTGTTNNLMLPMCQHGRTGSNFHLTGANFSRGIDSMEQQRIARGIQLHEPDASLSDTNLNNLLVNCNRMRQQKGLQFSQDCRRIGDNDDTLLGNLRTANVNYDCNSETRTIARSRLQEGNAHRSNQTNNVASRGARVGLRRTLPLNASSRKNKFVSLGLNKVEKPQASPLENRSVTPTIKSNQSKQKKAHLTKDDSDHRRYGASKIQKKVKKKHNAKKTRIESNDAIDIRRRPTFRELRRVSMMETQANLRRQRSKLSPEQIQRLDALLQVGAEDVAEAVKCINLPPFLWSDMRLAAATASSSTSKSSLYDISQSSSSCSSSVSSQSDNAKQSIPEQAPKQNEQTSSCLHKSPDITSLSSEPVAPIHDVDNVRSSSILSAKLSSKRTDDTMPVTTIKKMSSIIDCTLGEKTPSMVLPVDKDVQAFVPVKSEPTTRVGGIAVVSPISSESAHNQFKSIEDLEKDDDILEDSSESP